MIDIINSYVNAGYKCVLVTGRLVERNKKLDVSVPIERIIKYERNSAVKRLTTWLIGFIQIWIKVAFKYRNDNLFIVSNPPIAQLLPLLVRNAFSLLIFDVYPDAFSELGYLKGNSLILKWWKNANRKVYSKAVNIFTITESMKVAVQNYVIDKEINVVPVWTDNTFLKPIDPGMNPFLGKHNLSGKFVVLYSGNLGLSGDLDTLIDVAAMIDRDDIIFVIIGDGAKRHMISSKVEKFGLTNVLMLPWQPVSELPFSLASANLAVVTHGTKATRLAVPSKLFNYLSIGVPILCICAKGSEVEKLILQYDCGRSFEPDNITGMVDFIVQVKDNRQFCDLMKVKSLEASRNYNVSNVNQFISFKK